MGARTGNSEILFASQAMAAAGLPKTRFQNVHHNIFSHSNNLKVLVGKRKGASATIVAELP